MNTGLGDTIGTLKNEVATLKKQYEKALEEIVELNADRDYQRDARKQAEEQLAAAREQGRTDAIHEIMHNPQTSPNSLAAMLVQQGRDEERALREKAESERDLMEARWGNAMTMAGEFKDAAEKAEGMVLALREALLGAVAFVPDDTIVAHECVMVLADSGDTAAEPTATESITSHGVGCFCVACEAKRDR